MKRPLRNRYIFILDILLCIAAYIFTLAVFYSVHNIMQNIHASYIIAVTSAVIYSLALILSSAYSTDWIHAGAKEYMRLLAACMCAAAVSSACESFAFPEVNFPKLNIVANLLMAVLICGLRFAIRLFYKYRLAVSKAQGKRTLVIGAGRLAVLFLRDNAENPNLKYDIIGLIDDNADKHKRTIYGAKVLGGRHDIEHICRESNVEEIIFAIYSLPNDEKRALLEICSRTGCKVKILPGVEASLSGEIQLGSIREVEIEDLLERDPIKLDNKLIASDIEGKTILVTGGGGSIGSELCRQIIKFKPDRLVILDIYENTTYELQTELEENYPNQQIDVLIASVRDKQRLDMIFEEYKPDIVFHAAAHKHVPLMEFSPMEAIKNNVFGTYNVACCAEEYGVKRFVMISTDKAVNPTNVMGATKRICEMIIQTFAKSGKTEFVAVRFGNVLGSNGSVIPRFKKQIAAGGPVTVTHPEITRFFMTIPEAAQLVLQAAAYAKGGEIFVLDMGQPVKIYDMARKMIQLSGRKPDIDIKIEFTGLRPGEKLYEELLMNEEGLKKTAHSKIFVGQPIEMSMAELNKSLARLKDAVCSRDADFVKAAVSEIVPTYHREMPQGRETIQNGAAVSV